jgi:hypothetical protein
VLLAHREPTLAPMIGHRASRLQSRREAVEVYAVGNEASSADFPSDMTVSMR